MRHLPGRCVFCRTGDSTGRTIIRRGCSCVVSAITKKHIKSLDTDVYFIGFPKENFDKLVNGREIKSTKEGFDVLLNAEEVPKEEGYETWLTTVKAEPASTGDYNSLPLAGEAAEREVIKRLRAFPIESKTMMECVEFLVELRRLLNNK